MNKLQIAESEDDCLLKLSNEPDTKESGSSWDTHKISWLPSFGKSMYVFGDTVVHTRLDNGKAVTSTRNLAFTSVMQLLGYMKSTYGLESPIYQKAKKFFSEDDRK